MANVLSTLSPAAADDTAARVRAVATVFAGVADETAAARDDLGGWRGAAEAGFADRLVDLDRNLDLLRWTASAGAEAIEEYARDLGVLQGRLDAVDVALADVARRLADPTLDATAFGVAWGEQGRWQQSEQALLAEFDAVDDRLADRLSALTRDVPGRPRTPGEHVTDGLDVVAGQVAAAGFLTLGWSWDRDGWRDTVTGIPGALLDQARDPVGTLADALQWDDVREGRWGAVAGGAAAAAAGDGLGRAVDRVVPDLPGGRERPRGPDGLFLPQSLDEMLAGVDLVRMEDQPGAHTVARHVDVDDEFLKERIMVGLAGRGGRGRSPDVASRWTDLDTAERVVTEVLRVKEDDVRAWGATGRGTLSLDLPTPASSGVAWALERGVLVEKPVRSARVVLRRGPDGSIVVVTAYLEPV